MYFIDNINFDSTDRVDPTHRDDPYVMDTKAGANQSINLPNLLIFDQFFENRKNAQASPFEKMVCSLVLYCCCVATDFSKLNISYKYDSFQ